MINPDVWHGFECGKCNIVLDVRYPSDIPGPVAMSCPNCNQYMYFKGSWDADERGYGSRGDGGLTSKDE